MREKGRVIALLLTIHVPIAIADYSLVDDPSVTCNFIGSSSECEVAAQGGDSIEKILARVLA